jgi:hypothetical protein
LAKQPFEEVEMPDPAPSTSHSPNKRSGGLQRREPVIINADTIDRSALVVIITTAMIGTGGAVQIAYALKWKERSGGLGFRKLLQIAQGLGIEVRSSGRPIKLLPLEGE